MVVMGLIEKLSLIWPCPSIPFAISIRTHYRAIFEDNVSDLTRQVSADEIKMWPIM